MALYLGLCFFTERVLKYLSSKRICMQSKREQPGSTNSWPTATEKRKRRPRPFTVPNYREFKITAMPALIADLNSQSQIGFARNAVFTFRNRNIQEVRRRGSISSAHRISFSSQQTEKKESVLNEIKMSTTFQPYFDPF